MTVVNGDRAKMFAAFFHVYIAVVYTYKWCLWHVQCTHWFV